MLRDGAGRWGELCGWAFFAFVVVIAPPSRFLFKSHGLNIVVCVLVNVVAGLGWGCGDVTEF